MESITASYPHTIPIIVDSVKRFEAFSLTRCTYFSIEAKEHGIPMELELSPPGIRLPFLMIDLSGVIVAPFGDERSLFETADDFDRLFEEIDQHPNFFVDTNDLWFPTSLLDNEDRQVARGMIYRIGEALFREAYVLRDEIRSEADWYHHSNMVDEPGNIEYSEKETEALQVWQEQLIEAMKTAYHASPEKQLAKKDDRLSSE